MEAGTVFENDAECLQWRSCALIASEQSCGINCGIVPATDHLYTMYSVIMNYYIYVDNFYGIRNHMKL